MPRDLPPTAADRTASGSVAPAYFGRLFRTESDPWGFDTSPYEAAKYDATLAALPRPRYRRAVEVGCANNLPPDATQIIPTCKNGEKFFKIYSWGKGAVSSLDFFLDSQCK